MIVVYKNTEKVIWTLVHEVQKSKQKLLDKVEEKKKRMHASRVLEVEHGTFTPLVVTTTGGMADECKRLAHPRCKNLQHSPVT